MTKQADIIKQIIEYIKEHPRVRTAFSVDDDRIVVDVKEEAEKVDRVNSTIKKYLFP